jgi:hypothetical protein
MIEHLRDDTLAAITKGLAVMRLQMDDQLSHPELYQNRGIPYAQSFEIQMALRDLNMDYTERIMQNRLSSSERDAVFHILYGMAELSSGHFNSAYDRFSVACTVDVRNLHARRLLLLTQVLMEDNETLIEDPWKNRPKIQDLMDDLLKSANANPRSPRAVYFQKVVMINREFDKKSFSSVVRLCEEAGPSAGVCLPLLANKKGCAQWGAGNHDDAVKTWEESLKGNADYMDMRNNLIWYSTHRGTDDNTIELYGNPDATLRFSQRNLQ